jgi:Uma2 family endonuclease
MAVRDTARRKLTYEDYAQIPDDGKRHEIIDGVHYVSPSPNRTHQGLLGNLHFKLMSFINEHREYRLGEVYLAPFDVVLSPHDVVQPDLLFVSTARLGIITEANVQGAPDLAIEILSDSTRRRDETLKRDRYEQHGVQEYWIFDGSRKSIRIFRRAQGSGFGAATELAAASGQVLTTPLLPGLELPLREIFS